MHLMREKRAHCDQYELDSDRHEVQNIRGPGLTSGTTVPQRLQQPLPGFLFACLLFSLLTV